MIFTLGSTKTIYDDKVVVKVDDDKVYYYDGVYDLIIVNDIIKVNDKANDKVNDDDFIDILRNDYGMPNDLIKPYLKLKAVDDKRTNNKVVFKGNDDDEDFIIINNNSHINSIDKVLSMLVLINDLKNDKDSFILKDNLKDNDFNFDKDFVVLKMNKDIYNDNKYDFDKYIKFAYVVYNYDNDNVFVIIDKKYAKYVIDNLNYVYMPLSLKKSYDFLNNQIDKANNIFIKAMNEYKRLCHKTDKKTEKRIKYLFKVGNAKKKELQRLKNKINNIDNHIKDYQMLRQYIIKNNCYYDDLNKMTNLSFKSFKSDYLTFELKKQLNDIDKNNVNKDFKKSKVNNIDFESNKICYYFKSIIYNNNDNVIDSINYCFKELQNLYDNVDDLKNNSIELINKTIELKEYIFTLFFEKNYTNVIDIVDDINDIKGIIKDIKDDNKRIFNVFNSYYKNYCFNNVNDIINELNLCYDYLLIQRAMNNNYNEYQIYSESIFNTPMNKHRSIIKKEQSEFLKMSYNEFYKDDFNSEVDFYKTD